MVYKVAFRHTKTQGFHSHTYIDWTLVEADTTEEAQKEARQWVRKYRCNNECRNRVQILETRKVGEA